MPVKLEEGAMVLDRLDIAWRRRPDASFSPPVLTNIRIYPILRMV